MPSNQQSKLRPKGSSLKPLIALIPFIRPYKGKMLFAIFILLMASAVTASLPISARYLIDSGISSGNSQQINFYFKYFFIVLALISLLSAARFYLITWLGERIVADIRNKVYSHVIHQDAIFLK